MDPEERDRAEVLMRAELHRMGLRERAQKSPWIRYGVLGGIWAHTIVRQVTLIAPIVIFYYHPPHWVAWAALLVWALEVPTLRRRFSLASGFATLPSLGAPPKLPAPLRSIEGLQTADEIFEFCEALPPEELRQISEHAAGIMERLPRSEQIALRGLMLSHYPTTEELKARGWEL